MSERLYQGDRERYALTMATAMRGGDYQSVVRFFEPSAAFLAWARALRGQTVYDVGAGDGSVARALAAEGVAVTALDAFGHEARVHNVLRADGTTYAYAPGAVVMLCRPCHGDFSQFTALRAEECGAASVLYVGLDKNVDDDLGELLPRFACVLEGAGKAGEKVWRWTMATEVKRERVALLKIPDWRHPTWMREAGGWWRGLAGGGFPQSKRDEVLGWAELVDRDWQALDWSRTGVALDGGDAGWLSPEGVITRCDSREHDTVAWLLLKREVDELEAEGWVRVDGPGEKGSQTFRLTAAAPTEAQAAWLRANGHDLDPHGYNDPVDPADVLPADDGEVGS